MYENLINQLRELPGEDFADERDFAIAAQQTMRDAADVIEKQSRENKEIMFRANQLEAMNDALIGETGATDALIVASKTRWIPVTERLPFAESGDVSEKVLVTDGQDMAIAERKTNEKSLQRVHLLSQGH